MNLVDLEIGGVYLLCEGDDAVMIGTLVGLDREKGLLYEPAGCYCWFVVHWDDVFVDEINTVVNMLIDAYDPLERIA